MSKPTLSLRSIDTIGNQEKWLMCLQAAATFYGPRWQTGASGPNAVIELADQFYQALEERRQPQE